MAPLDFLISVAQLALVAIAVLTILGLAEAAIKIGAFGWKHWHRPISPPPDLQRRRQQLDAITHLPHRNAFDRGGRR